MGQIIFIGGHGKALTRQFYPSLAGNAKLEKIKKVYGDHNGDQLVIPIWPKAGNFQPKIEFGWRLGLKSGHKKIFAGW